MIKYKYEYRINKKGAECFRTGLYQEAAEKLEALRQARPNVRYELQSRSVRVNRYGVLDTDYKGRPNWSPWM